MPKVTASHAYCGREIVAKAFTKYFEDRHWTQGSDLIQASYHSNSARGVSLEDQARFELTTCIGLLVNSVPAVLWMLFHVLSDPKLLQDLRSELLAKITVESSCGEHGDTEVRLPIMALKSCCPLLNSTLKETLRIYSTSLSARFVTRDTILNGRYFLKAGSVIQIPAAVLHKDPQLWGSNATTFDPARFHPKTQTPSRPAAAFRAFGGGSTLCPGRQLATIEILTFISMFILQFDAVPVDGPSWSLHKPRYVNMTSSVMTPPKDLRVKVRKREEFRMVKWVCV